MSESESDGYDSPRAVTEDDGMQPDPQMNLVGLVVAAGTALVMLPLAPVLAVAELLDRVGGTEEA